MRFSKRRASPCQGCGKQEPTGQATEGGPKTSNEGVLKSSAAGPEEPGQVCVGEGWGAGSEAPSDTLQENEIARTANGLELN